MIWHDELLGRACCVLTDWLIGETKQHSRSYKSKITYISAQERYYQHNFKRASMLERAIAKGHSVCLSVCLSVRLTVTFLVHA